MRTDFTTIAYDRKAGPSPTPTGTGSPTPTPTETAGPETTEVSFTQGSPASGQFSDEATFEARLTGEDGEPIEHAVVAFTLVGEGSTRSFETMTDEDGIATVTPRLDEKPGAHQLTVRYEGDEERSPRADTSAFTVEIEDTKTELTVAGKGGNMTLTARLSDLDSPDEGVAGNSIDLFSDGEAIGSAKTDSNGVAEVPVPPGHRGANRTYQAVFSVTTSSSALPTNGRDRAARLTAG